MKKKQKNGLLGYAATMGIIVIAAKFLGLLRDILVANLYGSGTEAIAYETASRLPVTLFDLVIGGVVSSAFIPVFNSVMVKKGQKDAMKFANSYVNFILLICSAIAAAGIIFARPLVSLIAPDISAEASVLAVKLTRIMFPMIIFTGLAFSLVGILQSLGEFNIPALISLVSNAIMVAYLFCLNRYFGIVGLACAMLIGWMAQAAIQIPKVHSLGFRYRPSIRIFDSELLRAAKSALPILIGTWTSPICNLINTRFASGIEGGRAMTAIGYANRLYTVIVGIFSFIATNLLFPYFSRAEAEGDRSGAERMIRTSIKTLVYIIAPIAAGIMFLSVPFTSLVYERGVFTASDTALTATALSRYAIGMLFMAANEVIVKALFAAERPRISMVSSLISMSFNIILVTFLADWLGVGGIALASSVATALNLAINLAAARHAGICRLTLRDFLDILISLASAATMLVPIYFIVNAAQSPLLKILLSVLAGAPVYFAASVLLRSEEGKFIVSAVFRRRKQGSTEEGNS